MLKTLATGLLTRKLARGMYRVSPNPIVRAAGAAAVGMAISRMMRPKPKRSMYQTRAPKRGGFLSRAF